MDRYIDAARQGFQQGQPLAALRQQFPQIRENAGRRAAEDVAIRQVALRNATADAVRNAARLNVRQIRAVLGVAGVPIPRGRPRKNVLVNLLAGVEVRRLEQAGADAEHERRLAAARERRRLAREREEAARRAREAAAEEARRAREAAPGIAYRQELVNDCLGNDVQRVFDALQVQVQNQVVTIIASFWVYTVERDDPRIHLSEPPIVPRSHLSVEAKHAFRILTPLRNGPGGLDLWGAPSDNDPPFYARQTYNGAIYATLLGSVDNIRIRPKLVGEDGREHDTPDDIDVGDGILRHEVRITITCPAEQIQERLLRAWTLLERQSYTVKADIQRGIMVIGHGLQNVNPLVWHDRLLNWSCLQRTGLETGPMTGECVIDVLIKSIGFRKDGTPYMHGQQRPKFGGSLKGGKRGASAVVVNTQGVPVTRALIISLLLKARGGNVEPTDDVINAGFSVVEMVEVIKMTPSDGVSVYRVDDLTQFDDRVRPSIHWEGGAPNSHSIPHISIVVADGHVYRHELRLAQGVGIASVRPGLSRIDTSEEHVVMDHVGPAPAKMVYVCGPFVLDAKNRLRPTFPINEYARALMNANIVPDVLNIDDKTGDITDIMVDGRRYKQVTTPELTKRLIADYNAISKRPIKYEGQTAHSFVVDKLLAKKYGVYKSQMAPSVYQTFIHPCANLYPAIGWVEERFAKTTDDTRTFDVRRAYSWAAILLSRNMPKITIGDEFTPYIAGEEIIEHWIYKVQGAPAIKASKTCLVDGDSLYPGQVVKLAMEWGILNDTMIISVLRCEQDETGGLERFVMDCEELGGDAKLLINSTFGAMKSTSKRRGGGRVITADIEEVRDVIRECNASKSEYSVHRYDIGRNQTHTVQYDDGTGPLFVQAADAPRGSILWTVQWSTPTISTANYLMHHLMIIKLSNMIVAEHARAIGGQVLGYQVDSIVVRDPRDMSGVIPVKDNAKIGQIYAVEKSISVSCVIKDRMDTWNTPHRTPLDLMPNRLSLLVHGPAGVSKSYSTAQRIKEFIEAGKRVLSLAHQHIQLEPMMAEGLVDSDMVPIPGVKFATISAALGFDDDGAKCKKMVPIWTRDFDVIVIDEIYQCPQHLLRSIYERWINLWGHVYCTEEWEERRNPEFTDNTPIIIMIGDTNQNGPMDAGGRKTALDNDIIRRMTSQTVHLTENKRADRSDPNVTQFLDDQLACMTTGIIDITKYGKREDTNFHIALTNKYVDQLNQKIDQERGNGQLWYVNRQIKAEVNTGAYKHGQRWVVDQVTDTHILISRVHHPFKFEPPQLTVSLADANKNFVSGWAATCASIQSATVRGDFTIHQWFHFHATKEWRYTALTRGCRINNINIL